MEGKIFRKGNRDYYIIEERKNKYICIAIPNLLLIKNKLSALKISSSYEIFDIQEVKTLKPREATYQEQEFFKREEIQFMLGKNLIMLLEDLYPNTPVRNTKILVKQGYIPYHEIMIVADGTNFTQSYNRVYHYNDFIGSTKESCHVKFIFEEKIEPCKLYYDCCFFSFMPEEDLLSNFYIENSIKDTENKKNIQYVEHETKRIIEKYHMLDFLKGYLEEKSNKHKTIKYKDGILYWNKQIHTDILISDYYSNFIFDTKEEVEEYLDMFINEENKNILLKNIFKEKESN